MAVESLARRSGAPSREELVTEAARIAPILARNAERAERERRLPEENVEALRKAGFFRLWQPRRLGGLEIDVRTYCEIQLELTRSGCGSSAWYVFILNGSPWIVGMMSEAAQRDVWGRDPGALVCSQLQPAGIAKPAPGGVTLSGSWNFASGSHHAQWSLVGFPVLDASGVPVDQALALVPLSDFRVEESWFVCGMVATASDTLHAKDVFVPEHRIVRFSSLITGDLGTEHQEERLYQASFSTAGIFMLAPIVAGLGRAAFEATMRSISATPKRIAYSYCADTRRAPTTQWELAQASALLDSAVLQVRSLADAIDEAARSGESMSPTASGHERMRGAHAMRSARQAVDLLLDVQGASGFALANPIQRMWRDMNVASRHGFIHPENHHGVYGRALAGVEETISALR